MVATVVMGAKLVVLQDEGSTFDVWVSVGVMVMVVSIVVAVVPVGNVWVAKASEGGG